MTIGIMARTFIRPTLEATLDAVAAHGIRNVQFGLSCAGLPDLPDHLDPGLCDRIRQGMATRGISIAALSGTFNMIDPDRHRREDGLRRLGELAAACERLGTSVITLCTGTRDPENMWRRHPGNDAPEAWEDALASMRQAVEITEGTGVTLAFEPEVSNVVDSAQKARRLLDEIGSPRLKVVMDGANIFHTGELPRMPEILDEAFALLGPDIALAHAKDLDRDGEAGHLAAGTGLLDYDRYLSLLRAAGFDGALILHSLAESQVAGCLTFLRKKTGNRQ
ncbi:MAG: sugar phosphate isomerase/epimerase [Candidatus Latescibacteria bacterium]|nr:sugar phosphate isomerase/epimerase [Candidatus Latescibacterota bacterium]